MAPVHVEDGGGTAVSADLVWPQLPEGGTWTEVGRSEYTLGFDGSETMAFWEPGAGGELELADIKVSPGRLRTLPPGTPSCRVYWGSHGCELARGHEGDCDCGCCECGCHPDPDSGCVGKAPFYGPGTRFYGEDVNARGLPELEDS